MNNNIKTGICDACEREVPKYKLKTVREQYDGEVIARGTPGMVKRYYATVKLCPRCRILRKVSIAVGAILGFAYLLLWTFLYQFLIHWTLFILWVVFNPLVITVITIAVFRIITKCDTLVKTDFHTKEHNSYMQSRGKQINRTPKVAKSKRLEEINEKHFFDTFSETPHEDITLANHNGIPKESPEDAARRALNAQKELERLKALQSQKEDEEKCAKQDTIGIINSWSLLAFVKEHGKMQVGEFANKDTGEVFKACVFTKPDGTRTFVAFAAKMGELTPKQIAEMKNELQVVQLESGNYSLCKRATSGWEEVDLKESEPYSIGTVVKTKDFIRGWGIKVLSPKGCFGIMDVRIDESSWKVKRSYHNIIEGQGYVIGDIQTIEYDKETDILKVIFNYVLKEGYDAIWFNRQYSKICVTFYKQGEFVRCFDSEYDKAYTSLENLFAAFCALSRLDGDNAIVTLSGEAFQTDYILNYYDEKLIYDFIPLAEEDFVFSMLKKDDTDDYYLKQYSMTKEEYFSKNYNVVSDLTAKCIKTESWYPARKEYPELEIGKTYEVSHISVLRSSSWIILKEFGDKEYNAACFELFENDESIEKGYTNDRLFWAPYLRDRLENRK